jgi:predicted nucleic acid-binding protein
MSGKLLVFPDTDVLIAMIVYPRTRYGGLSLAGEVLELYQTGALGMVIGQSIVDELEEVIDDRFAAQRGRMVALLKPFAGQFTRRPTPAEIAAVSSACNDPADAPIFASAVIARPDIVLANDFEAFHTPAAKSFWQQHRITVESPYGLLCVFGRRQRREAPAR